MKRCNCDPLILDIIFQLYVGDTTDVYLDGRRLFAVDVTNGIRQGCTLSPLLFLVVVNGIITRLNESKM